eukprot:6490456-Amphidinium_carterae.1
MSTAMAYELSKGTSFLAAIGRLKPRIAADATGMTAELMHWMVHHPHLRAVTQSYLAVVMRRSVTDTAKFILNASRLVPLNKGKPGEVRPIAIGSMWRKLSAWLLGHHCSDQLRGAIGASQYGVYTPSGVARLVHEVIQDALHAVRRGQRLRVHQPHCDAGRYGGRVSALP